MIDRDVQTIGINSQLFGDQFPRKRDGFFFEVITKAEVPEHLKERMVTSSVSNIVQIVVLPACAHAFLGRGRTRIIASFDACEQVFELNHAGVGKHQRRVVTRDQWA